MRFTVLTSGLDSLTPKFQDVQLIIPDFYDDSKHAPAHHALTHAKQVTPEHVIHDPTTVCGCDGTCFDCLAYPCCKPEKTI
jgi:hypothetical protein